VNVVPKDFHRFANERTFDGITLGTHRKDLLAGTGAWRTSPAGTLPFAPRRMHGQLDLQRKVGDSNSIR
jgi:hypothetical protein